MTTPASIDSDLTQPDFSQANSIGWANGRWLPFGQIALPLSDLGVRQGVTAVERLRTYHGKVLGLSRHLRRLSATTSGIGIDSLPSESKWSAMIADLLIKNDGLLQHDGDLGITLLATPGQGDAPTIVMHVNRIDHRAMSRRQAQGQPVVVTDVIQPPAESWSRQWKVRCRLHYYMADRVAKQVHHEATGVLRDRDGSVTETSIANIAIVESGAIVSPIKSQVLAGITQSFVEELADDANLPWSYQSLNADRIARADEILLMGTDGGIWWGWFLGDSDEPQDTNSPGPIFGKLRVAFDRLVATSDE